MVTLEDLALGRFLMHISKVLLHALRREHGDVLYTQGLEDVLLEVIVERHAGYTFYDGTGPVDANAVLPLRSGFEHQWLA